MPDDEYTSESRSPSDDDEYDDSEDSRGSQGYDPRGSVGPRGSERVESPRRSGGSGWMCTAEASFGTANGDEPFDYSVERAWGTGATREAAAKKAFDDCLVLVNLAEARANINGQKRDGGTCTISQCSPSR